MTDLPILPFGYYLGVSEEPGARPGVVEFCPTGGAHWRNTQGDRMAHDPRNLGYRLIQVSAITNLPTIPDPAGAGELDRASIWLAWLESQLAATRTERDQARALLAEAWVECAERMPAESVDVLAYADDGIHVAFWSGDLGWWAPDAQGDTEEIEADVTHWRPLPAPPEAIASLTPAGKDVTK